MAVWLNLLLAGLLEILLIQRCYCKWNFFDVNGHRIRHNRYWKLGDYQQDQNSRRQHNCQPLTIKNGNVKITSVYAGGAIATYHCNAGYQIRGDNHQRHCMDGSWTGVPPRCIDPKKIRECELPPTYMRATPDIETDQAGFPIDTTVTYKCQLGFYTEGGGVRATCMANGEWDIPPFKCRPKSCGHPGDVTNGRRIGGEFFYKSKVVFLCNEGFKVTCDKQLSNMKTECQVRVCQADGRWSGSQPICKPIRCPHLSAPSNGRVSGMWTKVNSILTFSCYPGYYLVGSRTRRCQRDGKWDGGNATCKIWNCGMPPHVPHSRLQHNSTLYGGIAFYRCLPNTSFSGESELLTCGPDGLWTPASPKCLIHCNTTGINAVKVRNGTIIYDNESMKSGIKKKNIRVPHAVTVEVKCNEGYQLPRPVHPRCRNGSWSDVAICEPAPCTKRPPKGSDAQVRFYSLKHGSKAYYACYIGYNRSSGDDTLTCQFGNWIGNAPNCEKTKCPIPKPPEHGQVYIVGAGGRWVYKAQNMNPVHDDQIEYQCAPGYRIKGQKTAVCVDGEWRPPEMPECEIIRHKRLPIEWVLYKPRRHYMTRRT